MKTKLTEKKRNRGPLSHVLSPVVENCRESWKEKKVKFELKRSIAALQDLVKPEILKFGKTKYG